MTEPDTAPFPDALARALVVGVCNRVYANAQARRDGTPLTYDEALPEGYDYWIEDYYLPIAPPTASDFYDNHVERTDDQQDPTVADLLVPLHTASEGPSDLVGEFYLVRDDNGNWTIDEALDFHVM